MVLIRVRASRVECDTAPHCSTNGNWLFTPLQILIVTTATVMVIMVVTEILRSIVDRRRRERDGIGGTQDIALWGTLLSWLCLITAAGWSAVAWLMG